MSTDPVKSSFVWDFVCYKLLAVAKESGSYMFYFDLNRVDMTIVRSSTYTLDFEAS